MPYGRVSRERYARRAVVELGDIPGGYGWVFPKGDHVERRRRRLAERRARGSGSSSRRVCAGARPRPDELEELRGHRLPMRRPGSRIAGERVLLVGDAAGLIDPVSGDGMYECFVSSRLAAAATLDLLAGRAEQPRALRGRGRRRARPAAPRLVAAEARVRPLAARVVAARPASGRLAQHRAAAVGGELTAPGEQRGLARACRCGRSTMLGRARLKKPSPRADNGVEMDLDDLLRRAVELRRVRHPPEARPASDGPPRRGCRRRSTAPSR